MAMLKAQKIEYAKKLKKDIAAHKVVGVLPLSAVPDRLLQKVRNKLKPDTKVIIARKSLVLKAMEGDARLEKLKPLVDKNIALILSNKNAFEIHNIISSNKLQLAAKPNQISPKDLDIEAGETTIPPGQAVTDLKAAGIDVQIQKGKVVIAKSKTLVAKGAKITLAVAKALTMLGVKPFEASASLEAAIDNNLFIAKDVFGITPALVTTQIAQGFSAADAITTNIGYVTQYNVEKLVKRGYFAALGLGLATKSYEPGIVEKLIADAVLAAIGVSSNVPEAPAADAAPAA
ncbi:MAG: 50S ribosomal protein L10 [Candidatus Micrarchaeota archaeon]|nr:50S ribosomal protein L10 [Candidatus Micrarchaeota archaeon]